METSAESYLSNVVNGSVTMMAEAGGRTWRRLRPGSSSGGKKSFESKGFEVQMASTPAASRSPLPGVAAGDAVPASTTGEPRDRPRPPRPPDRRRRGPAAGTSRPVRQTVGEPARPDVRPFGRAPPARRRRPPAQGLGAGDGGRRGRAGGRRGRGGAGRGFGRPGGGRKRARRVGGRGRGGARRRRRVARLAFSLRRFGAAAAAPLRFRPSVAPPRAL